MWIRKKANVWDRPKSTTPKGPESEASRRIHIGLGMAGHAYRRALGRPRKIFKSKPAWATQLDCVSLEKKNVHVSLDKKSKQASAYFMCT